MSIHNNTNINSFFKNIGKWFNKNGNALGKGMQITGTTAMGIGMTGMFIHSMKQPSIFGCGSFNPYMMSGGCNDIFSLGGYNNLFGMGGAYNMGGCSSMMGQSYAAQMGMMARMQDMMSQNTVQNPYSAYSASNLTNYTNPYSALLQNSTLGTDNDLASSKKKLNYEFSDISDNQDSTLGKNFDDATSKLVDSDNEAVEGKYFNICDADDVSDTDKYKESISNYAKSYIAHIEETSGDNKDGISLEEFIKHETSSLKDKRFANSAKIQATTAFNKIDMNNDGKIDWREYAATMRTFDTNKKGKIDGQLSSEDYVSWSEALSNGSDTTFDDAIRKNFKKLFGDDD